METNDFLSHYGITGILNHAAREDFSPSTAPALSSFDRMDKTSAKRKSDFDESKVKRDGHGQFSRTNSKMSKDEFLARLDREWESEANLQKILEEARKGTALKILEKTNDLAEKNRLGKINDTQFVEQARKVELDLVNHNLVVGEGAYSPSGKKSARAEWTKSELKLHTYDNPNTVNKKQTDEKYSRYLLGDVLDNFLTHQKGGLMEELGDFLAHHGIKGMRWGVRRNLDSSGGGGMSKKAKKKAAGDNAEVPGVSGAHVSADSAKAMANAKPGSTAVVAVNGHEPKTITKRSDGTWEETHLSADAERMVKTHQKQGVEMSDREIKEAVNRANMIDSYNKIFSPVPNAELSAQVAALKLQQEYATLNAALNPSRMARLKNFLQATEPAWDGMQKLDKLTGGSMSKAIKDGFNMANQPRNPQPKGFKENKAARRAARTTKVKAPTSTSAPFKFTPNPNANGPTKVYNITDLGKSTDYASPFVPQLN